jgi:hypothetical protein
LAKKAVTSSQSGYNCAQSVLLALYEQIEHDGEGRFSSKNRGMFWRGTGRCGSTCGALKDRMMAVGIKYASKIAGLKKRAEPTPDAKKLYKQFEKQHGTFFAETKQEKVFKKVCANPIKSATENFLKSKNMVFLFAGNRQKRFNSLPLFN